MAANLTGARITLPASPASIHSLVKAVISDLEDDLTFSVLTLRAHPQNAGRIYLGKAGMTADSSNNIGYIDPGEFFSVDLVGRVRLNVLYVAGTLGDRVYVLAVEY